MSYPKLIRLVRQIAQATSVGTISWKETEIEDVYQISFSENSVRIGERPSRRDSDFTEFYLTIYNGDGEVIEDIGDEDGATDDERALLFRSLKETFETARRQAKGVDAVLDAILGDLDSRLPF